MFMIPTNKKDKNLGLHNAYEWPPTLNIIYLTNSCLEITILITYNYNIESCSFSWLKYILFIRKHEKGIRQSQNIMLALLHERADYQVIVYSCTKTDIINNALGFASSPVSLK